LGEKATDYMMLFLAPVLATRPQLSRFRFEILTALWSRYSRRPLWTNGDASSKSKEGIEGKEDIGNPDDDTEMEQKDVKEAKEQQRHEVQKLVEWLALALFGRHVRLHEAQAWKERCGRYLKAKGGSGQSATAPNQASGSENQAGQS
jgi:hypothetical protein